MRAGTGCGCGHQRRTPEPLVNQRQGTGVQLIKLSLWGNVRGLDSKAAAVSNGPSCKRRLSSSPGRMSLNVQLFNDVIFKKKRIQNRGGSGKGSFG